MDYDFIVRFLNNYNFIKNYYKQSKLQKTDFFQTIIKI